MSYVLCVLLDLRVYVASLKSIYKGQYFRKRIADADFARYFEIRRTFCRCQRFRIDLWLLSMKSTILSRYLLSMDRNLSLIFYR